MSPAEAIEFIRAAVDPDLRVWADLGAGTGTFTAALAQILGAGSTIYAVDNDPAAVRMLGRMQAPDGATIVPVRGDICDLDAVPALAGTCWDAVILANVLHFVAAPTPVLRAVAARLRPRGRVVLVEYDREMGNPWVPHPIPLSRAPGLAAAAGLQWAGPVARRPSRYQGELYCAVLRALNPQPDPEAR